MTRLEIDAELRRCRMELQALQGGAEDAARAKLDTLKNNIGERILKLIVSKMKTTEDRESVRWAKGLNQVIQNKGTRDDALYMFGMGDTSETIWFEIKEGEGNWLNGSTQTRIPLMYIEVKKKPETRAGMTALRIPLADVHNMMGSVQQWEDGTVKSWNFRWWLSDAVETIVKQIWV